MDNDLPIVVEYSELPKHMAEMRTDDDDKLAYRAGSIANHFFTLDFLKRVSTMDLEYHIAQKKITHYDKVQNKTIVPLEPNGIKLERFIFDVFPESRYVRLIMSLFCIILETFMFLKWIANSNLVH
jgi:UDP-N-acetylglucosamine/UDP-N-acetylgalactosamine diphosphorylase